ncbi:MAG TPA: BBP7 family outer membrane beta-barrel protein [Fimbriiglobus sp.]|jgi:hypothetical protein
MRKALLGSIAAVTAGAGFAAGQAPRMQPPAPVSIAPSVSGLMPAGGMDDMQGGPGLGGPGGMDPSMGMMPSIGYQGGPGSAPMGAGGPPIGPGGQPMGMGMDPMGGGYGPPPGGEYGAPSGGNVANRFWFNAAYTLFFTQPLRGAPFLTTSAPADGGLIGNPTTSVLHSTTDVGYGLISGFHFDGGLFRDADRRFGIELGGFMSGRKDNTYEIGSDATGQPLIARPFIDAGTGASGALFVAFPTFASGNVRVYTDTLAFGAELNTVVNWYRSCPTDGCLWNINGILGFRYFQLEENLNINQSSIILPGNSAPFGGATFNGPVTIGVSDSYYTSNRFYGGQFGFNAEMKYCHAFLNVAGKVAIGDVHQRVAIDGSSTLQDPTRTTNAVVRGGLYANASNIGVYTNDEFAVMPEGSVALGYNWCSWLTTSIGYNYLYINKVVRPGDQYTTVVNASQVPTSPSFGFGGTAPVPNPAGTQSGVWIQGVTFGLNARY